MKAIFFLLLGLTVGAADCFPDPFPVRISNIEYGDIMPICGDYDQDGNIIFAGTISTNTDQFLIGKINSAGELKVLKNIDNWSDDGIGACAYTYTEEKVIFITYYHEIWIYITDSSTLSYILGYKVLFEYY